MLHVRLPLRNLEALLSFFPPTNHLHQSSPHCKKRTVAVVVRKVRSLLLSSLTLGSPAILSRRSLLTAQLHCTALCVAPPSLSTPSWWSLRCPKWPPSPPSRSDRNTSSKSCTACCRGTVGLRGAPRSANRRRRAAHFFSRSSGAAYTAPAVDCSTPPPSDGAGDTPPSDAPSGAGRTPSGSWESRGWSSAPA
eukprot:370418-Pyramimonas_sp.AAC.1